ncbi:MAG: terminase family protein [Halobacteria archaeon]
MPGFHRNDGITLNEEDLADLYSTFAAKFLWFAKTGYTPHYWQTLFHGVRNPVTKNLCRFRHIVAGRRGGKTLSVARETVFYMLHPDQYWKDFHNQEKEDPLLGWIVTAKYEMGLWALLEIRKALKDAGLVPGRDYKEHKSNRWFEFENGSFLLFKTADEPDSLRGAGLNWLWFDEASFIPDERAWLVSGAAIADKVGSFVSSTTPNEKNWFYNYFWSPELLQDPDQARIEFWSIDNPYFSTQEWLRFKREYHPMIFKREFQASFDAMAGKELSGDWLHFYELSDIDYLRKPDGTYDMDIYVAVDPAISLSDSADKFAISAIGITKDRVQGYLLDQWVGRIPFPEQVEKIQEWHLKWKPSYIGIERQAYQAALVQQTQRLQSLPPIVPLWTRGKKHERILAMAPLFRIGRIKIRKEHIDFINEWINYDSERRNPEDDALDSVELCLRMAVLVPSTRLPELEEEPPMDFSYAATTASMWEKIAARHRPQKIEWGVDEHLGADW